MKRDNRFSKLSASFRDPAGYLFECQGQLFRQINPVYKENYEYLISSRLYDSLIKEDLLIPSPEVEIGDSVNNDVYKIVKPENIPFISYPYEWCFSQFKDAALLTLKIQKIAMKHGMSLKDASAYNVQFRKGKPIFIDLLSFEKQIVNRPWFAYNQFCRHFLAPLVLMSRKDVRLKQMSQIFIDGIPLDLTSKLLPLRTYFSIGILLHIHLHAKNQKYYSNKKNINIGKYVMRQGSVWALVDNLETLINSLNWEPKETAWADYYEENGYSDEYFSHKMKIVKELLDKTNPKQVWDLGSNDGLFSRIASSNKCFTISFDSDPAAVEKNYLRCKNNNEEFIFPLLLDLMNPSPDIGWENKERCSIRNRGKADTLLVLAFIHHLAISNNLPLGRIASFFSSLCSRLIIEFIPKDDIQIQKMLLLRKDIFPSYNQEKFENEFGKYFYIQESIKIRSSKRIIYLMEKR